MSNFVLFLFLILLENIIITNNISGHQCLYLFLYGQHLLSYDPLRCDDLAHFLYYRLCHSMHTDMSTILWGCGTERTRWWYVNMLQCDRAWEWSWNNVHRRTDRISVYSGRLSVAIIWWCNWIIVQWLVGSYNR